MKLFILTLVFSLSAHAADRKPSSVKNPLSPSDLSKAVKDLAENANTANGDSKLETFALSKDKFDFAKADKATADSYYFKSAMIEGGFTKECGKTAVVKGRRNVIKGIKSNGEDSDTAKKASALWSRGHLIAAVGREWASEKGNNEICANYRYDLYFSNGEVAILEYSITD